MPELVVRHQGNPHLTCIKKSKNYLSTKALKSLHYSLFHSVLIYSIQIWSSASPSNFACLKLFLVPTIMITQSLSSIFKHLNILPLDDLCKFFDLQFTVCSISKRIFCLTHLIICSLLMPIEEMLSSILLSELRHFLCPVHLLRFCLLKT